MYVYVYVYLMTDDVSPIILHISIVYLMTDDATPDHICAFGSNV